MTTGASSLVVVFGLVSAVVQAGQVELNLIPDGSDTAQSGAGPAIVVRGGNPSPPTQAADSTQIKTCEAYNRWCSCSGHPTATAWTANSLATLSYRLDIFAAGFGAPHTSGRCLNSPRINVTINSIGAAIQKTTTSVVRIHFNGGRSNVPYFVKISQSRNSVLRDNELTGPDGKKIPLGRPDSPYPVILSTPGQDYFLRTRIATATGNTGDWRSDLASVSSDLSVSVELAPLLYSGLMKPYISGGVRTESYLNVAVILLDGLPHCTATLVSPNVLVTAAHCVDGYMTKDRLSSEKVTAAFGSDYSKPLFQPIVITHAAYPNDEERAFDAVTLRHDIAVLYLKNPVSFRGILPAELHDGTPSWQQIKSLGTMLVFVGFGYDALAGEKKVLGIKRRASWAISGYDKYAVSFSTPGTNTCNGDSGGPAFLEDSKSRVLAALTSGGDNLACTYGFDTRIDAYLDWLKPRISQ